MGPGIEATRRFGTGLLSKRLKRCLSCHVLRLSWARRAEGRL